MFLYESVSFGNGNTLSALVFACCIDLKVQIEDPSELRTE